MTTATSPRPLRADAMRNRERLIDVAKTAFAELGAAVSLEEIARRAKVGIGTLYRHFPTRDAVIEAVYRRDIAQLAGAAETLLAEMKPAEALTQWLRMSIEYIASKKLIAPVLGTHSGGASKVYEQSGFRFSDPLNLLVNAALKSGEIRSDITAADLMQALTGLAYGSDAAGWKESALRLLDILMAGMRVGRT